MNALIYILTHCDRTSFLLFGRGEGKETKGGSGEGNYYDHFMT